MKRTKLLLALTIACPIWVLAADDKTAPDNTGKNERDKDHQTLTPGDQSERPEDVKLTQSIRQAIMKDKVLSITAKNIKIITASGRVTLRGPVNNVVEKTKIHDLARGAAGQVPVDNQLEIKPSR